MQYKAFIGACLITTMVGCAADHRASGAELRASVQSLEKHAEAFRGGPGASVDGQHALNLVELEQLLVGKTMILDVQGIDDASNAEYFAPNGSWTQFGGAPTRSGRYWFDGANLCVKAGDQRIFCRQVYRESTGLVIQAVLQPGETSTRQRIVGINDGH